MRLLSALLLIVALALPPGARADGSLRDRIETLVAQAEVLADQGHLDRALDRLREAEALTFDAETLDPATAWLPDLAIARLLERIDPGTVEHHSAGIVAAFDKPGWQDHPMRAEALARLGQALTARGRLHEAEPVLRAALAAADTRPGLEDVALRARFWLARAATDLGLPDAGALRAAALNGFRSGGPLGGPDVARLFHEHLLAARAAAASPDDDLIAATETFMRVVDAFESELGPDTVGAYRDLHAALLIEAGRLDDAETVLTARQAVLRDQPPGEALFFNGLRLALLHQARGDAGAALAQIDRLLAQAQALPDTPWRALAYLHDARADMLVAQAAPADTVQQARRTAYAAARQLFRANDALPLSLARAIDRSHPALADFAFGPELLRGPGFDPEDPGDAVLSHFLSGDHGLAQDVLNTHAIAHGDGSAAFQRNVALHLALSGDGENMLAWLADLAPLVAADQALSDELVLIEALGRFWTMEQGPADAPALFDRLADIAPRLPPDSAALAGALRISALGLQGEVAALPALLRDWAAAWQVSATPGPRDVLAALLTVEPGFIYLLPDEAAALHATAQRVLSAQPDLALARDYLALTRLLGVPAEFGADAGLVTLAGLVNRIAAQVPMEHVMHVKARHGFAMALGARDRHAEALEMLHAATDAYRAGPRHRSDVLAVLLATQAQLLRLTGRDDLGLAIARQARALIDPATARPDYVLEVIQTLGFALARQARPDEALRIVTAALDDPALAPRLSPAQRAELMLDKAARLTALDRHAEAAALLRTALDLAATAALPDSGLMSRLLYQQGVTAYHDGDLPRAWDRIDASNRLYLAERNRIAAASLTGRAAPTQDTRARLAGALHVGWALAEHLTREAAPGSLPD